MTLFELEIGLKFIQTPYINKRIEGINLLNRKADQLTGKTQGQLESRTNNGNWLTREYFLEWLKSIDIYEQFFGESLHPELTKKYLPILTFLYSMNSLDEKGFDLIWYCAMNKHEAY